MSADEMRAAAAAAAGLPASFAVRLQGSTPEELAKDAEELAAAVTPPAGAPAAPQSMEEWIRSTARGDLAERGPEQQQNAAPPTSFDGGPRGAGPPKVVDMETTIRRAMVHGKNTRGGH